MADEFNLDMKIRALVEGARNVESLANDVRRLEAEGRKQIPDNTRRMREGMRKTRTEAKGLEGAMNLVQKAAIAAGTAAAVYFGVRLASALAEANTGLQRIQYTLLSVTGDAKSAGQEFDYLKRISDQLGLGLQSTATGYSRLSASAKSAGVTTRELHEAFRGLSEGMTVLHAPAEEFQRILIQVEQGMSLGKIQMQDLRAIAQSLPKTFDLAAKAANRMGGNLQDMLKNGGIPAKEFFVELGRIMHEEYGPAAKEASRSLNAELNRLKNSIFELETQNNSFTRSFADAVRTLRETLTDPEVQRGLGELISSFATLINVIAKATAKMADFLTGLGEAVARGLGYSGGLGDMKDRVHEINQELDKMDKRDPSRAGRAAIRNDAKRNELIQERLDLLNKIRHIEALTSTVYGSGVGMGGSSPAAAFGPMTGHPGGSSNTSTPTGPTENDKSAAQKIFKNTRTALEKYQIEVGKMNHLLDVGALQWDTYARGIRKATKEYNDAVKAANKGKTFVGQDNPNSGAPGFRGEGAQAARRAKEAAKIFEQTRTPLENYQATIAHLNDLLATGDISFETYSRRVKQVTDDYTQLVQRAEKGSDQISQFAIKAARNMQSAFADFLFDPFKNGVEGMVQDFADAIRRMAAELAAQDFLRYIASTSFGQSMGLGKLMAGQYHAGGIAGASGVRREVSPLAFLGAPRFHSGGEVPAILKAGEEVLTRQDPRHRANGGGMPANVSVEVVNKGTPQTVEGDPTLRQNADGMVVSVVLKDQETNGPITRGFRSMMGKGGR